jgi:hypothetical protein
MQRLVSSYESFRTGAVTRLVLEYLARFALASEMAGIHRKIRALSYTDSTGRPFSSESLMKMTISVSHCRALFLGSPDTGLTI